MKVLAVLILLGSALGWADEPQGQVKFDHDESAGFAAGGYVFQVSDVSGNQHLVSIEANFGEKIVEKIVYRDGSAKISEISSQEFGMQARMALSTGEVRYVEFYFSGRQYVRAHERDGADVERFVYAAMKFDANAPMAVQLRLFDNKHEWDLKAQYQLTPVAPSVPRPVEIKDNHYGTATAGVKAVW